MSALHLHGKYVVSRLHFVTNAH